MGKHNRNEIIVAALLQHGTIQEAAAAAGTTPRTIYNRLRDDREFRGLYQAAKADVVRTAAFSINEKLSAAINATAEIMENPDINAQTRLQAAQTIINSAGKFTDRLYAQERLAANESEEPRDFFGLV